MILRSFSSNAFVPGLLLCISVANAEDFSDIVPLVDPFPLEPVTIPSVAFQPLPVGNENKEFLPAWISAQVNGALRQSRMPAQKVSVKGGKRGSATQVNLCLVDSSTHNSRPITNICVINGVIVNGQ